MRPPFATGDFGPGMRGGRRGGPGEGFGPEGFGGRGRGRGPGRTPADVPDATDAAGWFAGRLPDGLFAGTPTITVDREEITVIGDLPPLTEQQADPAAQAAAEAGRIARFREETREVRIEVARQAEHRYARHVTWGARLGGTEQVFTALSVPVMTRLAQAERQVLDTLIDAGVARSRSEALAWSVRLVGEHAQSWLGELRDAMEQVNRVRSQGPGFDKGEPSS
nr:hypothetical protein [Nakamurella deserti]